MCGIGGMYRSSGQVDSQVLHRMVDSLRHRGPDDSGIYANGRVGLAHTRLKVIDLSPLGRQPMVSDDGQVVLAYNGEVFNFRTLRTQLKCAGHHFRGNSDTEVVLRAYLQWNVGAFDRFEGMFALALWDGRERRLHLVRDRFGIKPLYVQHSRGELTFGSEIKTILTAGGAEARADFAGLHEFLYYGTAVGGHTMFEGIGKLLPGHALAIDERGMRCEPYFSMSPPARCKDDFETAVGTVRGLIDQAIRSHLTSDVPVGVFLSGGVDSSAITAIASSHYQGQLTTFTAAFDDDQNDNELPAAKCVAEQFGTDHHEVHVGVDGVTDVIERLVRCHDEPFGDPAEIALFLLSKEAGGHATVILQGDGGDEVFGGYRRHALMSHLAWWRLLGRGTVKLHRMLSRFSREESAGVVLGALAESDIDLLMARLLASESPHRPPTRIFSAEVRNEMLRTDPFGWHRQLHNRLADYDLTSRLIALDASITLPDLFFEKVDKPSMYHSIEVRVPMMDARLTEYAMKLPSQYRVRGRQKKVVLRAALRGLVSDATLDKRKTGLAVPISSWLKTSLADYAKSILLDSATRRLGIFDDRAVALCLKEHCEGRANNGRLIYKMLQIALWCDAYRPSFQGSQVRAWSYAKPVAVKAVKQRARNRVMFVIAGLERGGAEVQLVDLAKRLAARGWDVTVVSYLAFSARSLAPALRGHGVRLISLNAHHGFLRYASILRAASIVRHVKPDVLVGLMFHGMMTARVLGWLFRVRANVSAVHAHADGHGVVRSGLLHVTRAMPDAVVALSDGLRQGLVRKGIARRNHMWVVPNGMDMEKFGQSTDHVEARGDLGLEDGRFVWLAAGRLEREKDYPNMLRAFKILADRRAEAMLIIAGRGTEEAALRRLIERLDLCDRVRLLGLREDVPTLLRASDALVLSSEWEAMPMVVLEAMALRRPVVATSVGAIPELIEEGRTGFLVSPRDSAALAGAMERLMDTAPQTIDAIMEDAHARVRTMCSFEVVLDKWEALFDHFLHNAGGVQRVERRVGGFGKT